MKISKLMLQDFSSNAELRLHASNTEDVGSISSQRAKIPHVMGKKKKKKDPTMREQRKETSQH